MTVQKLQIADLIADFRIWLSFPDLLNKVIFMQFIIKIQIGDIALQFPNCRTAFLARFSVHETYTFLDGVVSLRCGEEGNLYLD
jgi:hypothetical protein